MAMSEQERVRLEQYDRGWEDAIIGRARAETSSAYDEGYTDGLEELWEFPED